MSCDLIIDRSGRTVLDRWTSMCLASEQFVYFTENGKEGLYDLINDVICIQAEHEALSHFNGNVLVARNGSNQQLIDLQGKRLSSLNFTRCRDFVNGIAAASVVAADWESSRFGFINEAGEWVLEPQFKYLESPAENGFAVAQNHSNRFIYVDRHGDQVFERTFDWANQYSQGMAGVKQNGREYYVDETGQTCIEDVNWYSSEPFSDGFALVLSREVDFHVMFIDRHGDHAFDEVFPKALAFRKGVAPVQVKGRWGAIDTTGDLGVEAKFESLHTMSSSELLRVKQNGKYGYVDKAGNWVLAPRYEYAGEVIGALCRVSVTV